MLLLLLLFLLLQQHHRFDCAVSSIQFTTWPGDVPGQKGDNSVVASTSSLVRLLAIGFTGQIWSPCRLVAIKRDLQAEPGIHPYYRRHSRSRNLCCMPSLRHSALTGFSKQTKKQRIQPNKKQKNKKTTKTSKHKTDNKFKKQQPEAKQRSSRKCQRSSKPFLRCI